MNERFILVLQSRFEPNLNISISSDIWIEINLNTSDAVDVIDILIS